MKGMPAEMSRRGTVQSTRSPCRRVVRGIGSRKMINADTRKVSPSTQSARNSRSTFREANALKPLSHTAEYESSANASEANGNVPNAAKRPSEFADVSCFVSTRLGIDASFAGPHNNERISSKND